MKKLLLTILFAGTLSQAAPLEATRQLNACESLECIATFAKTHGSLILTTVGVIVVGLSLYEIGYEKCELDRCKQEYDSKVRILESISMEHNC